MPNKNETYLSSLNTALHELMTSDERVVVIGEDILDPYGGAFKVTKGLSSRFPSRVFTTPISESAIVGMSAGLALRGMRPIAEIMFGDFLMLASDQLINHSAKFRWMYNNQVTVPMVVRTPAGAYRSYGATHSQSLEKHFMGVPGLWVVSPHILDNPGRLLKQAVELEDPVLFMEHKHCYAQPLIEAIPEMFLQTLKDASAPFPTVWVRHQDADPSMSGLLFCYGGMVPLCLEAVTVLKEQEGITMDLVILSQLSPVPQSHLASVFDQTDSSLCVYVEESCPAAGWAAELIAVIEERRSGQSFQHVRIGAENHPIPSSRELEKNTLPSVPKIVEAVLECF